MTDFLVAESAIGQLHARYVDAVWRMDFDAFANCFTEDCEWRIGGMVMKGRPEIVDCFKKTAARFHRILVTLRTPIFEVGDGKATGRTYLTEQNSFKDGRGFAPIGIYYERFVDQGDQWRFQWRLFQVHYAGPADMSGKWFENPDYGPPPNMPPLDAIPLSAFGTRPAE